MPERTILVVDDDPVIRQLLEVNFEMEGFRVRLAVDGADGLASVRAEQPDIVILDMMMPKLNGLQVAEAIRAEPAYKDMPIIMLSAKAQSADIAHGLEVGVDEYVTKPFDPFELLERVNALLGA